MSEETNEETVEQVASSDWRESIPEDLRSDPSLADVSSVAELAKMTVHAQRMIGADKVVLPGRDAPQEVIDEFYNKLGRPDTPDGYEVPTENMPNLPYDEDVQREFFKEAHRIGLNKQQAAAITRWQADRVQTMMEESGQANEEAYQNATDTMRKEFGKAFDEKMDMAKSAARQFGGDELMDFLDKTGLGNAPAVIRAFANIGKAVANDEIIGGGGRQGFIMSPSEAKSQIASLKRDPNFMKAYTDTSSAGHIDAVQEMGKLFETAHPDSDE